MIFHERWHRSAIKSASYRLLSISVDSMVAYFFTRDAVFTAGIVAFVNGYSTVLYYLHERLWNRIHVGKEVKGEGMIPAAAPKQKITD